MTTRAVFITNAGPDIGGGHLSRCFALAGALERLGAECSWILNESARRQAESLRISEADYFQKPFETDLSELMGKVDFAVVDSYIPGIGFYMRASERAKLVIIDDIHDRNVERCASVLINYGIGARREFYDNPSCEYLIGPRYALLREDYSGITPEEGDYVLFVPGAADVMGCGEDMARWWRPDMRKLVIALGALVGERARLDVAQSAAGKVNVEVLPAASNFASVLSKARFVICSASVTAYESLAMEKNTAVFAVADNQRGLGERLKELGAAYNIGDWKDAGFEAIKRAIDFKPDREALRGLVNRDGARLCAETILNLLGNRI